MKDTTPLRERNNTSPGFGARLRGGERREAGVTWVTRRGAELPRLGLSKLLQISRLCLVRGPRLLSPPTLHHSHTAPHWGAAEDWQTGLEREARLTAVAELRR